MLYVVTLIPFKVDFDGVELLFAADVLSEPDIQKTEKDIDADITSGIERDNIFLNDSFCLIFFIIVIPHFKI